MVSELKADPINIIAAIIVRGADDLTGVHEPGESHFELLRAFAPNAALDRISKELSERGYQGHEFGDSMLLERQQVFAPDGISRAGAAANDALAQ